MLILWILIATFISLYVFYEINRKNRLRREEKHEELNNRRQEVLQKMLASRNKKSERLPNQSEQTEES